MEKGEKIEDLEKILNENTKNKWREEHCRFGGKKFKIEIDSSIMLWREDVLTDRPYRLLLTKSLAHTKPPRRRRRQQQPQQAQQALQHHRRPPPPNTISQAYTGELNCKPVISYHCCRRLLLPNC
jgi:hypothetical protein